MAKNETKLYKYFLDNLKDVRLSTDELAKPDPTIEQEVTKIYTQARGHRTLLVYFYISYTIGFTLFVFALIASQAIVRVTRNDTGFEIIPHWALNLLVVGMFGQFVGLLTIVTRRVWDFKPFLSYHHDHQLQASYKMATDKPDQKQ